LDKGFKKKEQLLAAAINEFGKHRFEDASLNRILQKAKVSKGLFYHYYENKDALYIDIAGILLEKKKAFIAERLGPDDLKGDVFQILKKGMTLGFEFGEINPLYAKFSTMLMRERGSQIFLKVMAKYNVNNDSYVSGLIRLGINNGNIRSDLSPEFVFRIISHILNNVNEILDTKDIEDYKTKIDELLIFMESALRA